MPSGIFDRTNWRKINAEKAKNRRKYIDIELLKKRYLVDNVSTNKLAKEFNVNNGTLRKRLIELGIKIRSFSEAQKLINHPSFIERLGYDKWYGLAHSKKARIKRSNSHTGKKFTKERRINMSKGIGRGINNKTYKKDAKYKAIHSWLCSNVPKKHICSYCGDTTKITHWANLDWKYDRERLDSWLELCPHCNLTYDKNYKFRIKLLKKLNISNIDIPSDGQKNTFKFD